MWVLAEQRPPAWHSLDKNHQEVLGCDLPLGRAGCPRGAGGERPLGPQWQGGEPDGHLGKHVTRLHPGEKLESPVFPVSYGSQPNYLRRGSWGRVLSERSPCRAMSRRWPPLSS